MAGKFGVRLLSFCALFGCGAFLMPACSGSEAPELIDERASEASVPTQVSAGTNAADSQTLVPEKTSQSILADASSPAIPLERATEQFGSCMRKPISQGEAENLRMRHKFAPGGAPLPIFLNRYGGTFSNGWNDSSQNISSIAYNGAVVPAFDGSDNDWNTIKGCVEEGYAAFNLWITDQEPQAGEYIEVVVGGHPSDIGVGSGVGGISPYNCDVIPKSIVFVFEQNLYGNQNICEVILHEVGHSLSLDHEYLCEDPMTYLSGCGDKSFQNQDATCGEYSPRSCDCNRNQQNSVEVLTQLVGLSDGTPPPDPVDDNGPPTVFIAEPSDGDLLPAQSQIQVVAQAEDDLGLSMVNLVWDYTNESFPCPGSAPGVSCTRNGSTYTWTLNVGNGTRTFHVEVRDIAGNTSETNARTITLGQVDDGNEPPPSDANDMADPTAQIIAPVDEAIEEANSQIQVVATATDDVGIASVSLEWDFTDDVFSCPISHNAVSCVQNGSTYTWSIQVGTGQRDYRIRAVDLAGKTTVTQTQTLYLSDDPPTPEQDDMYEPNNTWDYATSLTCDQSLDLRMLQGDHDWFRVSMTAGMALHVRAEAELGEQIDLFLATGPNPEDVVATDVSQNSVKDVLAVAQDAELSIHTVGVSSAPAFDYQLEVTCVSPEDVDDGSSDDDNPSGGIPPKDPNDQTGTPPDLIEEESGDAPDASSDDSSASRPVASSGCSAHGVSSKSPALFGLLVLFGGVSIFRRRRG